MPKVQTHLTIPVPQLLSPDAPKDYGRGRKCECGARINRYSERRKCDLCQRKESDAKFEKEMEEIEEKRRKARQQRNNGQRLGNLLALMHERGISRGHLAKMLDVDQAYIERLEKRVHGAPRERCKEIASIFGVAVKALGE